MTSTVALVGIGGPSCSGKSTVTNYLASFLGRSTRILHQDKWFRPDSEIPSMTYTTSLGLEITCANWDTLEALDCAAFNQFLVAIKDPQLSLRQWHDLLGTRFALIADTALSPNRPDMDPAADGISSVQLAQLQQLAAKLEARLAQRGVTRLVLVDGFLLYTHPDTVAQLDVKILLQADYHTLKSRREARFSYKTIEGMWEDPPEYFDHCVWPEYVKNHAVAASSGSILRIDNEQTMFQVLDRVLVQLLSHL
ncbi:ribosylnicotinamide kinase [Kappamyces sp. JEL0829]|nr:ribosylnicotinamide kinase [Kappamyces sp. JEL0829]